MTATQLAGGFGLLGAEQLSGPIEESFVARLDTLSDDGRRLLLVAAADPLGDPLLLWRAANGSVSGRRRAKMRKRKGC